MWLLVPGTLVVYKSISSLEQDTWICFCGLSAVDGDRGLLRTGTKINTSLYTGSSSSQNFGVVACPSIHWYRQCGALLLFYA